MSTTERIAGEFSTKSFNLPNQGVLAKQVIADASNDPSIPGWSTGYVRLARINAQPTLSQPWKVIGFSIRAQAFLNRGIGSTDGSRPYGHLGDLWAGLITDTNLQEGAFTSLPNDLSTFTRIFNGDEDSLSMVQLPFSAGPPNPTPAPIGNILLLPEPIIVNPGSQLFMALILTPMLTHNIAVFDIYNASYTVLYEQGKT